MKNYTLIIGICLLGLFMGCQKNDVRAPVEIALQNEPPLSFNLVSVPDDATGVDITPTLSWESAKNPKGALVSYDLYLDTNVNPTTFLKSDITDTSFEISDRLYLLTDYYWKVVAKDADGKTSQSSIYNFTTRNLNASEEALTKEGEFSGRFGHTLTAFDNQLWMMGGYDGDWKNDIWNSNDGINWTEVIPTTPFSERRGHTSTVFKDKLWVIGGYNGNPAEHPFNDVWSSSDGVHWELALAAFSGRNNHTAIVFDNKLWVIGGGGDDGFKKNDVWFTSNGSDWEMATDAAAFSKRNHHVSLVFDNKMWIFGGSDSGFKRKNDAWYSTDGINWTKANTTLPYSERTGQTCTVLGNKIWMIGGLYWDGIETEAMYSSDGVSWESASIPETISGRGFHGAAVLRDRLLILGGQTANLEGEFLEWTNDVWVLD